MKINLALCDDDARALPVIAGAAQSAFSARGVQTELRCFLSGEELLAAMEAERFQLLLLDIEMPGMDGIELGEKLRALHDDTRIIYVSEAEARVFESFSVKPLCFVRKGNFLSDIAAAVDLYIKTLAREENETYLEFPTRTGILRLRLGEIRYIERSRSHQLLYAEGKSEPLEIKISMDKLEAMTVPYGFIRAHKGYLVNHRFISHVSASDMILTDGSLIPLDRVRAQEIKEKYLSLL